MPKRVKLEWLFQQRRIMFKFEISSERDNIPEKLVARIEPYVYEYDYSLEQKTNQKVFVDSYNVDLIKYKPTVSEYYEGLHETLQGN